MKHRLKMLEPGDDPGVFAHDLPARPNPTTPAPFQMPRKGTAAPHRGRDESSDDDNVSDDDVVKRGDKEVDKTRLLRQRTPGLPGMREKRNHGDDDSPTEQRGRVLVFCVCGGPVVVLVMMVVSIVLLLN